jgi:hypothetical protein
MPVVRHEDGQAGRRDCNVFEYIGMLDDDRSAYDGDMLAGKCVVTLDDAARASVASCLSSHRLRSISVQSNAQRLHVGHL